MDVQARIFWNIRCMSSSNSNVWWFDVKNFIVIKLIEQFSSFLILIYFDDGFQQWLSWVGYIRILIEKLLFSNELETFGYHYYLYYSISSFFLNIIRRCLGMQSQILYMYIRRSSGNRIGFWCKVRGVKSDLETFTCQIILLKSV